MRASLSLLRSLSFSLHQQHHLPRSLPITYPQYRFSSVPLVSYSTDSHSTFVEHSVSSEMMKHMGAPSLEVKELEELPEQWRRSKLAWLCKELPALTAYKIECIMDMSRKWLRQEDATYVIVHFTRIPGNGVAYWVYNWMKQQYWYRFDFALATKVADSMGKQRILYSCQRMFDEIINHGHMPSESTFHILIDAYLIAIGKALYRRRTIKKFLDKACDIYNRMIRKGGYQPHINLHNSLFRTLISKPGGSSKHYLKQAEYIFQNLVTSGLEIQKDIYVGLIWLHSYQDSIDKERIASLREEMRRVGINVGEEVLLSVLRVCSKEGDVEEAERICLKLLDSTDGIVTQAFVYKMLAYAKIGEFTKSLDIFRGMRKLLGSATIPAYHEIIDELCKVENIVLAESVLDEFVKSGTKPPKIMPSYINLTNLDLGMRDRLHLAFSEFENILGYNMHLESLIKADNVEKAEEVFNQMQSNEVIGTNARSYNSILSGYVARACNSILSGHPSYEEHVKVENMFDLMLDKDYDVPLDEDLDYILMRIRKGFI